MIPVLARPAAYPRPVAAGGGGGPPAGYAHWYDASRIVGLADGAPVSPWPDLSGNGYDAASAGAARPTYRAAQVNGLPAVRFDGVANYLEAPSGGSPAGLTAFAVVRRYSAVAGTGLLSVWSTGSFSLDYGSDGLVVALMVSSAGTGWQAYWGGNLAAADAAAGGYHVLVSRFDPAGDTHQMYADGAAGTGPFGWAGSLAYDRLAVGSRYVAGYGSFGQSDLAELVLYPSALSDTVRQAVEAYLMQKYNP